MKTLVQEPKDEILIGTDFGFQDEALNHQFEDQMRHWAGLRNQHLIQAQTRFGWKPSSGTLLWKLETRKRPKQRGLATTIGSKTLQS